MFSDNCGCETPSPGWRPCKWRPLVWGGKRHRKAAELSAEKGRETAPDLGE